MAWRPTTADSSHGDPDASRTHSKLLVVNLYYAPDVASSGQLLAELCCGLARHGLDVSVVAGQPSYTTSAADAPSTELLDGVKVYRVPLGRARGRERILTRLVGYARFMWGAWRLARKIAKSERPDVVLTLSNPPVVGLIGSYLAMHHKLRYVYVLYDIHPDVLLAANWIRLPAPVVAIWNAVNRYIMGRAHTIVVLGNGMRSTLVKGKGVPGERVRVIPIWGRPELNPEPHPPRVREELGVGSEGLLLLYAGNMGIMHPIDSIVDAAAMLRELPARFVFLGDGAKREALESRVERESLDRVTFLPFQPEDRFIELLNAADACFVALEPGMERFSVPSRAFTFLSASRPLITLMAPDADIARLVTEQGCGWNVTTAEDLADLIRRLTHDRTELASRGHKGRLVYEQRFQREHVIDRYVELLRG